MKKVIIPKSECDKCGQDIDEKCVYTCDHCGVEVGLNALDASIGYDSPDGNNPLTVKWLHFCDWECVFHWLAMHRNEKFNYFLLPLIDGVSLKSGVGINAFLANYKDMGSHQIREILTHTTKVGADGEKVK
jgi:hypothetical protein